MSKFSERRTRKPSQKEVDHSLKLIKDIHELKTGVAAEPEQVTAEQNPSTMSKEKEATAEAIDNGSAADKANEAKANDQGFNFEREPSKNLEFFTFETKGDFFIGYFLEKLDGTETETNPHSLEGFKFRGVDGQEVLISNYWAIDQFINKKIEDETDFSTTIFKIVFLKKEEKPPHMIRFDFFSAPVKVGQ